MHTKVHWWNKFHPHWAFLYFDLLYFIYVVAMIWPIISGLWGEIRSWEDGTTIVQKTHDANKHHVQTVSWPTKKSECARATRDWFLPHTFFLQDYGGRAILILRNPYDAILSTHNFMYAGHHGKAPARNYARPGEYISQFDRNCINH